NVNTTGFKRSQTDFQDLIYITRTPPGAEVTTSLTAPTGLQIGSGVRVAGTTKSFLVGDLENTGNALDLAIEGDGFFQVTLPNGQTRYTRDGALRLNAQGNLVTTDGFLLSPQITIPQDAQTITVGADGTIAVLSASNPSTPSVVGSLQLVRFVNPAGLSSEGHNLYMQTNASGTAITTNPGLNGAGLIRQGFLERSNVDVVSELVHLILAQRAYEFNTKAIKVADDMLSSANSLTQ
ncbi:MAG TPA: flagellar basal-body rod protein FlgG, partial [Gemmataceae bacterium]|nr:flagellar basal-body rod protein FlgG [Gemmataceae bacterium]